MFKKEKVRFTYKNGFTKAEFKNVSDKHLDILKRDICKEQIRRKEAQPFGKAEQSKMTFGQKLRRFLRRLSRECHRTAIKAATYMDYTYRGEESPLTAEEMRRLHIRPSDKVMVLGDTKNACRTG